MFKTIWNGKQLFWIFWNIYKCFKHFEIGSELFEDYNNFLDSDWNILKLLYNFFWIFWNIYKSFKHSEKKIQAIFYLKHKINIFQMNLNFHSFLCSDCWSCARWPIEDEYTIRAFFSSERLGESIMGLEFRPVRSANRLPALKMLLRCISANSLALRIDVPEAIRLQKKRKRCCGVAWRGVLWTALRLLLLLHLAGRGLHLWVGLGCDQNRATAQTKMYKAIAHGGCGCCLCPSEFWIKFSISTLQCTRRLHASAQPSSIGTACQLCSLE